MATPVIVVRNLKDFKWSPESFRVITARDYLDNPGAFPPKTRIVNLGRNYEYLGHAYYCSLLAEARQHRVVPAVRTLMDLRKRSLYQPLLADLDALLERSCVHEESVGRGRFRVHVLFGRADIPAFQRLAQKTYSMYPCPILRIEAERSDRCRVRSIGPVEIDELPLELDYLFEQQLRRFARADWSPPRPETPPRWALAILHDPKESLPPSDEPAIRRFVRAGERLGIEVELIQKKDLPRLAEYDALFIRETTAITHHTYQFSQRAELEGLVVIDDPASIMRCTNKVYLAELLRRNGVPAPKSLVVSRRTLPDVTTKLPFPIILKIPDGSFSLGVHKVESRAQLEEVADRLFEDSDLILAQEYMYTTYDWRVGVLGGKPLYVCQYFMAPRHWQIVSHGKDGSTQFGGFRAWAVEEAPPEVIDAAVRAASLIGDGLYGVDLKQTDQGVFVIEVNDNPNIDHTVEDGVLKDRLYEIIMEEFLRRLERYGQPRADPISGPRRP